MADDNVLWVGGLADEVTEDLLYELFLQAGPLDRVSRPREKDGSLRKFAFVEFQHAESVPYAIQVMDGVKLFGQHLRLKSRTGSTHSGVTTSLGGLHLPPTHHSSTPSSPLRSHPGSRSTPDFQRSRSYHGGEDSRRGPSITVPHLSSHTSHPGHSHHRYPESKPGAASGSHVGQSFNLFSGPAEPLAQSFSSMACFAPSNMKPQSIEDRRNRLMQQQAMTLQGHMRMGNQKPGSYNLNYSQSFANYGYGQQVQQWYPLNQ